MALVSAQAHAAPPPRADPARGAGPVSHRFPDLDAYLAWLEKRAHLGGVWYREVRPGLYERQPSNFRPTERPNKEKRLFTRKELEAKFGFPRR